jgi:hypothetical protein
MEGATAPVPASNAPTTSTPAPAPTGNPSPAGDINTSPPSSGGLLGNDTHSLPPSHSGQDPIGGGSPTPPDRTPHNDNTPWTHALPENFRENVNIQKYKSMEDFMNGHVNLVKKIGEKGIERPGADADQSAWDAFYEKVGRPTTADGYSDWKAPTYLDADGNENALFELDPEQYKGAREEFHRIGLSDEQAQAVMSLYANTSISQSEAQAVNQQAVMEETVGKLRQDWGDKFDAKMKSMNAIANQLGIMEDIKSLGLANNYSAIKMLEKLSSQVGEAQITGDHSPMAGGFEARMAQITNHPAYKDRTHPEHHKYQQMRLNLYQQKFGS